MESVRTRTSELVLLACTVYCRVRRQHRTYLLLDLIWLDDSESVGPNQPNGSTTSVPEPFVNESRLNRANCGSVFILFVLLSITIV